MIYPSPQHFRGGDNGPSRGRQNRAADQGMGRQFLFKMYDPQEQRPDVARRLGNTQPGDGVRFCGRGYVQLHDLRLTKSTGISASAVRI